MKLPRFFREKEFLVTTTVVTLAACLQALFTSTARALGRSSGLVRRQRDLSAEDFAQTLVFGWIDRPGAALETFATRLDLSGSALQQRMNGRAQAFFAGLLGQALSQLQRARPARLKLLQGFGAVVVEDTSIVPLPADLAGRYRGQGGSDPRAGRAGLKVLVRWELLTGQLLSLRTVPAVTADAALAARAEDLPAGALHLADQGFFDAGRWRDYAGAPGGRRYWISRVPAKVAVACGGAGWCGLGRWLAQRPAELLEFDGPCRLAERRGLPCRLTARRCPPEVAARRRQKLRAYCRDKKGREPSAEQLAACGWQVLATNVPAARLSAKELWLVYRSRWQVELLFKRGKSQSGWSRSLGRRGERVLVEVLAKLLGWVVVHWLALLQGGPLAGVSPVKQAHVARSYALRLADGLRQGAGLEELLGRLLRELSRLRPQSRRKAPGTRQLLTDPSLAA